MSKLAGLTGVQGVGVAAVAVAAIAGGAAWFSGAFEPEAEAVQPVALMPTPTAAPKPKTEPVAQPAPAKPDPQSEPEVAAQQEPETEEAAPLPVAPSFDLLRVEPDGSTTIAGRADPSVEVVIELDGQEVGRAQTGADGSFVQFLTVELSDKPRLVRLWVAKADGAPLYSADNAVIAPIVVARTETKEAAPEAVAQTAPPEAESNAGDGAGDPVETSAIEETAHTDPETTQAAKEEPEQTETADPTVPGAATADPEAGEPVKATAQTEPGQSDPEPEPVEVAAAAIGTGAAETPSSVTPQVVEPKPEQAAAKVETDEAKDEPALAALTETENTSDPEPEPAVANNTEGEPAQASGETTSVDPEPQTPKAPAVIIAGQGGVKVVQPLNQAPEVMSAVALDTISYSEQGDVQLAGRGQGSGFVRVYVDNRPVTTSRIAADGNWRTGLPDVDTGVYTLRVDEIDEEGQVVSRVETPFKREDEGLVAEAGKVSSITVQPGHTLWAIATDNYGEGDLYVRLYEANRDRIRNPDLIYPGQVFDIPEE